MDLMTLLFFLAGLALLTVGAEILIRGSSRLAAMLGISPLIIGLTVVAFSTSSPELAVSIRAALAGQTDIAVGNVVGSNIFNILLILGLSAAITPLAVSRQLIRLDIPVMIGVSFLLLFLGIGGRISRVEGIILFTGVILYTAFLIFQGRKEKNGHDSDYHKKFGKPQRKSAAQWTTNLMMLLAGLGMLVLGARWMVDGAVVMARAMGVSEFIIGLTIVAAGTSLPEVAASVVASIRKERDMAVGNVIGSNIFNILSVLGLSSALSPGGIAVSPAALNFDIPVMIAVAVACLPIFFHDNQISRWEGFLFLGYYVAYTAYLILSSTQHDALPFFSWVMSFFVIPLTAITLLLISYRQWRKDRPA